MNVKGTRISQYLTVVATGLGASLLVVGLVSAATTISTNVTTGGTLSVTGLSSLGQASSTMLSANTAYFGQTATSTFSSAGVLTLITALAGGSGGTGTTTSFFGGLLYSDGTTYRQASSTVLLQWDPTGQIFTTNNASTTNLTVLTKASFGSTATTTINSAGNVSVAGTLDVTGATTLASTTATGFKVGQVGTRMTRVVSGYCVTGSISIPSTGGTQTQTYADCTPSGGASVITSGDRVFVQATSSLPFYVVIQAASSTVGGLINVSLTNFSTTTSPSAAVYAFNFWAFQ